VFQKSSKISRANSSIKNRRIIIRGRKTSILRISRLLENLTQDQLSVLTRINIARISRIENGFLPGTPKERTALSSALKKDERLLFPEEEKKDREPRSGIRSTGAAKI